jgi:hypothetical protein
LLQWKPHVRLALLLLVIVAVALLLSWSDGISPTFLEW